jgi:hypothetical protein
MVLMRKVRESSSDKKIKVLRKLILALMVGSKRANFRH